MKDTLKIEVFGFVSHPFEESPVSEVFFHIKSVKRTHPELAKALGVQNSGGAIYFWYEFGVSEKGQQVLTILDLEQVSKSHVDRMLVFMDFVEKGWMNAEIPLSESIREVTSDLFLPDGAKQLAAKRALLEEENNRKHEEIRSNEVARFQKIAEQKHALEDAEEVEFRQLVAQIAAMGFTRSSDVSAYIFHNQLGTKYRYISGILQMEMDGSVWDFNGGFPSNIYARLCSELGLKNQGSAAKPRKFTSYNDIINK